MATDVITGGGPEIRPTGRGRIARFIQFLRDVRNELRKVTWPTWNDAWNSSLIVLLFVVVVTGFIFASDFVINRIMGWIL